MESSLYVSYDSQNEQAAALVAEFTERMQELGGQVLQYMSAAQEDVDENPPTEVAIEATEPEPTPEKPPFMVSKQAFFDLGQKHTQVSNVTVTWRKMIGDLQQTPLNPGDEILHWKTSIEFNLQSLVQLMRLYEAGKLTWTQSRFASPGRWRLYIALLDTYLPDDPKARFINWHRAYDRLTYVGPSSRRAAAEVAEMYKTAGLVVIT